MSEGAQKDQKEQTESETQVSRQNPSEEGSSADREGGDLSGSQPRRARTAAPLLVEVYGRAVQRNSVFNTNKIFLDFIEKLVSSNTKFASVSLGVVSRPKSLRDCRVSFYLYLPVSGQ